MAAVPVASEVHVTAPPPSHVMADAGVPAADRFLVSAVLHVMAAEVPAADEIYEDFILRATRPFSYKQS